MNWLIYIAGWFWGLGLTNSWINWEHKKEQANFFLCFKLILWTMTWIWICWRFIK